MADFPPNGMTSKEDAAYYDYGVMDNTVRSSKEGGDVSLFARARNKRRARRTFETGFTEVNDIDKGLMEGFYLEKQTSLSFTWVLPHTVNTGSPETVTVRLVGAPMFEYKGIGITSLWSIRLKLEEV